MKPLRVMHVVVAGDIGGAERLLVDLATRPTLSNAEHAIALVTPNRALHDYFDSAGLRVHERGAYRESPLAYLALSFGPSYVAWLTSLFERERIDIVHTHTFASHVVGTRAAKRAKLRQLRTEHHVMHYFDPSCSPFTRWAAARTDAFVAVSDYVKRTIIETAPVLASRMSVVRNGVDTAYFAPDRDVADDRPFSFAVACRLTAWKRVHLAIEAAATADVDLVIAGDGEERTKLEALARTKNARVTFVGHQKDPRGLVLASDATISTAKDEPLGLSVLESLSMERAVIAIKGGGLSEIVRDGDTGILVPEPRADALARALGSAKSDRAALAAMGKRGRAFVTGHCSIERMCEGYGRAYASLAGEP